MSLAFNANFTPLNDLKDLNDFNAPKALNDLIYHQVLPLKPSPFRLPELSKRGVLITKKEVLQKLLLLKDLSLKKMAATYSPTLKAVPSACTGLTSLFGMGRGGTPAL